MHVLQPKHIKLDENGSESILSSMNISKAQLPKILLSDPALPEGCEVGDVIKIERKDTTVKDNDSGKLGIVVYYRVVV